MLVLVDVGVQHKWGECSMSEPKVGQCLGHPETNAIPDLINV